MLDYSSPANQLYAMLHYGFALLLLLVWWPRFFLGGNTGDAFEDRIGRLGKAVCLYIVMGYALVWLKLYEVISVFLVLMLLSTRQFWRKGSAADRDAAFTSYSVWFYELTEIGFRLKNRWQQWRGKLTMIRKDVRLKNVARADLLLIAVFGGIVGVAAYLRLYDPFRHAPPAFSDGVVTLAWMKYISHRIMFHDGIYPQGYHIILSLISKFAAIDELYILRYTGPVMNVVVVIAYYFMLSRLTGSKAAGVVAAAMFGLGGFPIYFSDWERQAASNSQEFAMLFAFPCLYFILRYLMDKDRRYLWNGMAACLVTGLVHAVIFAYAGLGICVALIAVMLSQSPRPWRQMLTVCIGSLVVCVISYTPIQLGEWFGAELHSSSATYLTEVVEVVLHPFTMRDYVGLGTIAVTALSGLIGWSRRRWRTLDLFAVGLGTATFLLYYVAPYVTQSSLLNSRGSTLWIMYDCFGVGYAWWAVWRFFPGRAWIMRLQLVLAGTLACGYAVWAGVGPIIPYKMQWESEARVYLKIASMHQPMTWTIFSNDQDYALAYGNGWHQYLRTLIDSYDPTGTPITRNGQDEYDADVTPWMYVIEQKNIYVPPGFDSPESMAKYKQEEQDNKDLEAWIASYEPIHGRPPVVYEDENLRVYLLERPDAKDKRIRRLWGVS